MLTDDNLTNPEQLHITQSIILWLIAIVRFDKYFDWFSEQTSLMILPLLIAVTFIVAGGILIRSARKSLSTGKAETDENDIFYKAHQPIRFFIFIIAQIVFGCLLVLAGLALIVASFHVR
ncbi:MAG: hypothetical protein AB1757_12310 [Acidobacteriota bacterium]